MVCYWKEFLELLPIWLRSPVDTAGRDKPVGEIRLRLGQPPLLTGPDWEQYPTCRGVSAEDLNFCVNTASRYSPYAALSLGHGYLTAKGGHRLGVCGSAVIRDGQVTGWKELTSLCLRVARDIPGTAAELEKRLGIGSILILGPPGSGKTTLLRDLIRQISQARREQVAVVDERGELFPAIPGGFCFSPGLRADVLAGVDKGTGIALALRSMSPDWIAVDEITALSDCETMEQCGYCGVRFLATAHAWSREDLQRRPVYRRLLETGLFAQVVCMNRNRTFTVERLKGI